MTPIKLILHKNKVILTITLFLILFYFDLPRSHVDDIWYLDAAINLTENGELKAPRLSSITSKFSSDHYFLSMPFYSYILCSWFKVFGLATYSMILFQYVVYFLNIIFLRRWLLKKGISSNISTISSLIFMIQSFSFGFRPESLGFCFMFAGLLMLQNVRFLNFFSGFMLLGFSIFISHNVLAIALTLMLFEMFKIRQNSEFNINILKNILISFFLSSLLICLLFSFSIYFRFFQLFEQINWMVQNRSMGVGNALPYIFHDLLKYWNPYQFLPLYIIFSITSAYLILFCKNLSQQKHWFLISLIISVGLHFLLRPGMYLITLFLVWILILTFISLIKVPINFKRVIHVLLACIFLFQNSHFLLGLFFTDSIDKQSLELIEKKARNISGNTKNIVIDDIAARYVFDFNYPPNSQAALMDLTPPPSQNNIWIVSPSRTAHHFPEFLTNFEKLKLFGRKYNLLSQNPYEIIIIDR